MIDWIRRCYATPSAQELAHRELDEARRALLEAQSSFDYAAAMVDYHQARIERLTRMLENVK